MITMPKRSVTRFFIPLIDVLLLLFCIFLLMPMAAQESRDVEEDKKKSASEKLELRNKELEREKSALEELVKGKGLDKLLADSKKLEEVTKELEALHKLKAAAVQDRLFLRVIDIHPETGALSYYDTNRLKGDKTFAIDSKDAALYLIKKHRSQAGSRELYYYFHAPGNIGFPNFRLQKQILDWFDGAPHSLAEKGK
jgi:biopolymer transport protein ExbD